MEEDVAIPCHSKKEWDAVRKELISRGCDGLPKLSWEKAKKEIERQARGAMPALSMTTDNGGGWCWAAWYRREGFKIITADEFLGKKGGDKVSAYLVSNDTINRIVTHIQEELVKDNVYGVFKELREQGYTPDKPEVLGQDLFDFNCLSLDSRYDEGSMYEDCTYAYEKKKASKVQLVKSISCYLYQSCEGECDKLDFFKMILEVQHELALEIVQSKKNYDDAEWE